ATVTKVNKMTAIFRQLFSMAVSEHCYDTMFQSGHLFDIACLKLLITKGLGYGIILGSIVVKLPQIIKIFASRSSRGLSFAANLLELVAISATASYGWRRGFPFSAYGEGLFMAFQTSLIAFLTLFYSGQAVRGWGFLTLYALIMAYLMSPRAPFSWLQLLQTGSVPLTASGKLWQAWYNYRNSSTGQLSLITCLLLFLGSVARIFTSVQETGDQLVVVMYTVSTACNGIILAQISYYWNADRAARSKAE
ncbi:hypothetical protein BOX15_Mlig013572g3, partial [Macrostomum lignano]